jgi:hypothetical protein
MIMFLPHKLDGVNCDILRQEEKTSAGSFGGRKSITTIQIMVRGGHKLSWFSSKPCPWFSRFLFF